MDWHSERFRNHISIVAEQLGRGLWFVGAVAVGGVVQNVREAAQLAQLGREAGGAVLQGLLVALVFLVILVAWQILVWARTFISIDGTTLVIERNTLNRKVNTIGIGNISNVNTEQNLFEMLVGTCKIKIDTNSLSTADSTDVKIVLKKREAEAFCARITRIMEEMAGGQSMAPQEEPGMEPGRETLSSADVLEGTKGASLGAMLVHGFYQASFISVGIVLLCLVGAGVTAADSLSQGNLGKSIAEMLLGAAVVLLIFVSAVWDLIKGFIQYYDFKVMRREDKLYISYGLLKKVRYTIPVDKINALKITQSIQGRLTGRWMAEIINVGMGDDQEDRKSFLLLYDKKEQNAQRIRELLPEFAGAMEGEPERSPRRVWGIWAIGLLVWAGALLVCAFGAAEFWPQYQRWIFGAAVLVSGWTLLMQVFAYRTAGMCEEGDFLILSQGYLGRRSLAIRFGKIQYLRLKQNALARRWKMAKGQVYLLAGSGDRSHKIPYFREEISRQLKEGILDRK